MGSKFFVHAGKRWRELDTEDGNLEGWGRARFLYFKQGRLNVARRGAVLRALRALEAGDGLAARDGLPLSKHEPEPPSSKRRLSSWNSLHSCCFQSHRPEPVPNYCLRCANDERFDRLKPNTSHMAVQCVPTANASTQASLPSQEKSQIAPQTQREKPNGSMNRINVVDLEEKSKGERKSAIPEGRRKRKRSQSSEIAEDNSAGDGDHPKELIIEESDVEVLRRFLVTNKGKMIKVDIKQFDQDDAYKEKVFYAINPLVSVERCPRISQILEERRNALSIKEFMTVLGLRKTGEEPPVKRYKTRASIPHHDKENAVKNKYVPSPKRSAKVLREDNARSNKVAKKMRREEISVEISSGEEFTPKAPIREACLSKANRDRASKVSVLSGKVKSVKAKESKGSGREYSNEEDLAIVEWVSQGTRARSVNGNKIWQQMPKDHHNTTGIKRSWHSLRNRYLRHLLPTLGRLASPHTAQRLRADASTGELKARKVSKENSLLAVPSVRSAWSRRPRPLPLALPLPPTSPRHSHSSSSSSSHSHSSSSSSSHSYHNSHSSSDGSYAPSMGRSSTPAVGVGVRRTPRFSEVLDRFADRASSGEGASLPLPHPLPLPSAPAQPLRRRLHNP